MVAVTIPADLTYKQLFDDISACMNWTKVDKTSQDAAYKTGKAQESIGTIVTTFDASTFKKT